jgi:hypothetical protein
MDNRHENPFEVTSMYTFIWETDIEQPRRARVHTKSGNQ